MKTITIGRIDCDIIIPDSNISRHHATISLVNGQYVYYDMSKNGTTINGRVYNNEKVVVAPGTPIYLSNKVPLPWAQVLMLLPESPILVNNSTHTGEDHYHQTPIIEEDIGCLVGGLCFLFPIVGIILFFVWRGKHETRHKAGQAGIIALIGIALNLVLALLG